MKRKFTLWLNILTICLCICIIAIGVYSAQNASLTISGSVGFKAHNCEVDITAYIWGDSVVTDSSTSESVAEGETVRSQSNRKLCGTKQVRGEDITGDNALKLGKMYFGDMTDDGSISPITIEFDIVNQSAFAVDVEITPDISIKVGDDDYTYITTKRTPSDGLELAIKDTTGSTGTLSLQLTLKAGTDTLTETPEISFNISMYKHVASSTLSSNWNSTDSETKSSGIFSEASPFGSDIPTLIPSTINSISFLRELPSDIDTYAKAESLNLANNTSTESPITAYAKASTTANLYDVIIYSPGKIYAEDCVGMFSPAKSLDEVGSFFEGGDYSNCWMYLNSIDFDNLYTNRVTNMLLMFTFCASLTSLGVSNFDTSSVTGMSDMFYSCEKLTSLDLSNFDTSSVTTMSHMFAYCQGLTSLDVSNFDTSSVTNMSYMFDHCQGLTSLDVSNFDTSSVTNMTSMFEKCQGLTSLDVSNFDTSKVTNMWKMFYSCQGLTSLDVSNFDTRQVTDMGSMFYYCQGLTSLDLSNFDTSNVTNMTSMFEECQGLTSLDLSSFDTSKVTYMSGMFKRCLKLTTIYVAPYNAETGKGWNVDNVKTSSNSMFLYCPVLKGGADTEYRSDHVGKTYAHIDGGTDNPGYLTDIAKKTA